MANEIPVTTDHPAMPVPMTVLPDGRVVDCQYVGLTKLEYIAAHLPIDPRSLPDPEGSGDYHSTLDRHANRAVDYALALLRACEAVQQ